MRILSASILAAPLLAIAQPPAGYYDAAAGLSGEPLRAALKGIIDGHTVLDYGSLWYYFGSTDDKANGQVWDMYSDDPSGTPPYTYTFITDQCGEYDSEGDCFNREHSFPKSWFGGDVPPMNSDLHHLYPTDGYVNNKRGELPYGEVGSVDWNGQNGSKTGQNASGGYNGTVFEPIDAYKGDFARAYFYMLTRYWGQTTGWSSPMLQNGDLADWAESMLVVWNNNDPVSAKEADRNNTVFTFQHNRNPFIDDPQWVHFIWGPTAGIADIDAELGRIWQDGEMVRIRMGRPARTNLSIFDPRGALFLATSFTGDQGSVHLDAPAGIYLVVLETDQGRQVQRVVR